MSYKKRHQTNKKDVMVTLIVIFIIISLVCDPIIERRKADEEMKEFHEWQKQQKEDGKK